MAHFAPGRYLLLSLVIRLLSTALPSQTYWMNHGGGPTIDEGMDVATDAAGNAGCQCGNGQLSLATGQLLYVYTTGLYYLTISDTGGCAARDSFAVNFTPNLLNAPVVSDTTVCRGQPAFLTANGTPVFNWCLSASGGTPVYTETPFATAPIYSDTAFYVQSDDGVCRSMMSVVYVHQEDCPPVTPNVFTPNGDGVNDGWSLYRPYAEGIHVWIYDRWGMLVYEYTEPDGYWDGTYMGNGKPVTDGVYYFIAYITDTNAMITGESGFIQLIRNGPK